ncbi:hypothetical protein FEM41_24070 [Jejubacter calystegiae]|uniref:Uncharacterized protein n=1 Tax=Jejubacter calystegiae TaxID=2579935 RepID=A0A4P8YR20_9ENTR|nr:hypothetical protein [Jejubacter calystegiae]QCT22498.1 hypothetical protein FEM41_24070 [Jejubacter calystegiae]
MVTTLARKLSKILWFAALFYLGLRLIDPAKFISLHTTQRFALWAEGSVSQENFDDLWVLAWVVCSFLFATVGYLALMWTIRKVRR